MADLLTRCQLRVLAHTLQADERELSSLLRLDAAALRALEERISNALFDAHEQTFSKVARLAPLIPDALVARVALAAIPPEVGGRAGGALGLAYPDRVAGVLAHLTPEYLADAAGYLDPRAIAVLASRIPAAALVPAAELLLRRRDYLTTARFVEHATDDLVRAFEQALSDDAGLLHTAASTASTVRLNELVRIFPATRQIALLRAAAADADETLLCAVSVLARLDLELRQRLTTALIAELEETGVRRLFRVALDSDAVEELLIAVSAAADAERAAVADMLGREGNSMLIALSNAAESPEARRALQDLAELVPSGSEPVAHPDTL
ncbi:hypothetical protein [Nocardia spumae]|uniref:hypothetical protein n=1 Tax=Nocardia spumae TaxID=2887190 RepID=UPI001D1456CC|nr:hypothetical protein [Nocardia spumae]